MRPELLEHFVAMRSRLLELQDFLEGGSQARRNFDELLDVDEFECALHALCDYLLEPMAPRAGELAIEKIANAHQAMGLKDNCVERLKLRIGEF